MEIKKTVHFEINGKRYDTIEDAPPEFREMLRLIRENPEAFKDKMVKKVMTTTAIRSARDGEEHPETGHREKFLHESVLPNLHLLDPKAQAEVLRALMGEPEKQPTQRSTIFWMILYAVLGLLLLFGFNAIRDLVNAPAK